MRLAYMNALYYPGSTSGGSAHIRQFIANAAGLGHEVWTESGNRHDLVKELPSGRLARLGTLRTMNVVYTRLEWFPPGPLRWAISPYREILASPLIVWEFNTVPEFGQLLGKSHQAVEQAISAFRHYGQGCDLAICVSDALTSYVRKHLGVKNAITVPNGSDPDLFRPDSAQVRRMQGLTPELKVVWIGSADLPWHDFGLLRAAADFLWEHGGQNEVSFHIIGQGIPDLRTMPPNVHYYGPELYEQLPHWLSAMDVGLALYQAGPSDYGSPLKLFDYMASGLAVVATAQPQVCDVFAELGQSDWVLKGNDPKELAELLMRLALDRQLVKRQGIAARNLAVQKYNWKLLVARIFSEIETSIRNRRS